MFKNCASATVPVMDISMIRELTDAFMNMKNLISVTFQNCNRIVGLTSLSGTFRGCSKLLREPTGLSYEKCTNAWAVYMNCSVLKPERYHSFPVCIELGDAFRHTANWDEYDSYTIDAPVAKNMYTFLCDTGRVNNCTVNVSNPNVNLNNACISNFATDYFEVTINNPSYLTGDLRCLCYNRQSMHNFPIPGAIHVTGDVLEVNLYGTNIDHMFYNCRLLQLPITNAIHRVNINAPYAISAKGTFTNTYIFGAKNADLPLVVSIDLPKATDVGNFLAASSKVAGSLQQLTINAPLATYASYCFGNLMVKNGYSYNLPLAKPLPNEGDTVPLF